MRTFHNSAQGQSELTSTDDIGFLEGLIASMVESRVASDWQGKIDPERVYTTGFSMGCMMAHRIALERSNIIAGRAAVRCRHG